MITIYKATIMVAAMPAATYLTLSTIIAWLAATVLVFGLFAGWCRQRWLSIKGRKLRRCPKCWYDLSATPGLTCSECGYTARRERKLYKSRRRWKLVFLAIFLFLGSYALRVTPGVKQRGWPAAVPTTALVLGMPFIEPTQAIGRYSRLPKSPDTISDALTIELFEGRIRNSSMWNWQKKLLIEQCLSGDAKRIPPSYEWMRLYGLALERVEIAEPSESWWFDRARNLIDIEVITRPEWPVNVPMYAEVRIRRWNDAADHLCQAKPITQGAVEFSEFEYNIGTHVSYADAWRDRLEFIGVFSTPTNELEYEVELLESSPYFTEEDSTPDVPIRQYRLKIPTRITEHGFDQLTPVESSEIENRLGELLAPTLTIRRRGQQEWQSLTLWKPNVVHTSQISVFDGVTLAFDLTVLQNNEAVATGAQWHGVQSFDLNGTMQWYLHPTGPLTKLTIVQEDADWSVGDWEIEVRGSPSVALRNFKCDKYWAGVIRIPLDVKFKN